MLGFPCLPHFPPTYQSSSQVSAWAAMLYPPPPHPRKHVPLAAWDRVFNCPETLPSRLNRLSWELQESVCFGPLAISGMTRVFYCARICHRFWGSIKGHRAREASALPAKPPPLPIISLWHSRCFGKWGVQATILPWKDISPEILCKKLAHI